MLLHELITHQAAGTPDAIALRFKDAEMGYKELADGIDNAAAGFLSLDIGAGERVAVYLPKRFETVLAMFGASRAGAAFVPVNPVLKAPQVGHILSDCNTRILVTSRDRAPALQSVLADCHDLHTLLLIGGTEGLPARYGHVQLTDWSTVTTQPPVQPAHRRIDMDMAAILYTSGSTGRPKGVILSHRNMVSGALSVAEYLENTAEDRLLAVLPFSFDYGLSQLTTAFSVGASVTLMDYLLPRDVIRAVVRHAITGLAAVPPLWTQLGQLDWPKEAAQSLRYITNSGGAMPRPLVSSLRMALPGTRLYLMYGLTEAFRSTYLPPEQIDARPGSMGMAIPNAEILVVREDGSPCAPGEPGELVHRGALVSLGYWNDAEHTAERFRPVPGQPPGFPLPEIAVWSGDTVKMDEHGHLYFIGRRDEMIKTSGYRVSPTEIEEVLYSSGLIDEAVALGIPHPSLGQGILVTGKGDIDNKEKLLNVCRRELPNFMVPLEVIYLDTLPRNPNGKIDRKALSADYQDYFSKPSE